LVVDSAFAARKPLERIVVEDDGDAVGAQMHVALDRVAAFDRRVEGRQRVFPAPPVLVVVAAMRDRPLGEPGNVGHAVRRQLSSTIASISTAALSGNTATPTAERACLPRSPSASARKSEAPLATRCCSVKPGAEATKTVIFSSFAIRSRSPAAALICARMLIAHSFAACLPASVSRSLPSRPVA